jgi:hypothetical protein
MEGKLIKLEESKYTLVYKEGNIAWENNPAFDGKLSLKNCEAIANGYDLDELVKEQYPIDEPSFKRGFKLALEILGDKKFTEKELTMLFAYGHQIGMNDVLAIQSQHSPQPMPKPDSDKLRDELIQSLQQTEWDVEIEMWFHGTRHKKGEWIPKLDADGCLILKRK